ncbi:hypothetical protein VE00_01376 [Pseudogymnoascus sp. WSF 3629]|nr:hypothetical protein VE00_01376 [Pseudogymnoascus sp. WSF 3629]
MAMSWNIKVSRKSSGNSERGVERNPRRKFGVNRRGYRGILTHTLEVVNGGLCEAGDKDSAKDLNSKKIRVQRASRRSS